MAKEKKKKSRHHSHHHKSESKSKSKSKAKVSVNVKVNSAGGGGGGGGGGAGASGASSYPVMIPQYLPTPSPYYPQQQPPAPSLSQQSQQYVGGPPPSGAPPSSSYGYGYGYDDDDGYSVLRSAPSEMESRRSEVMNDAQTLLDRRLDEIANTMMCRLDENSATTNRTQAGIDSLGHLLNQHILSQAAAAVTTGAEPPPTTDVPMALDIEPQRSFYTQGFTTDPISLRYIETQTEHSGSIVSPWQYPLRVQDVGTEQGPGPGPPPVFVRPQLTGRRRGTPEIEAPPPAASLATRSPQRGVAPTWQYPMRVQDLYTVHEPSEGPTSSGASIPRLPLLQPDHLTIARAAMISPETTALALGAVGPSPLLLPSTNSENAPSTDMVMFHPGTELRLARGSTPGKTRRLEGPPPVLALPPPPNPEG